MSLRGSRPPLDASHRTVRSCAPPTAATPIVAFFRLLMRRDRHGPLMTPVRLRKLRRDGEIERHLRHQGIDDLIGLPLWRRPPAPSRCRWRPDRCRHCPVRRAPRIAAVDGGPGEVQLLCGEGIERSGCPNREETRGSWWPDLCEPYPWPQPSPESAPKQRKPTRRWQIACGLFPWNFLSLVAGTEPSSKSATADESICFQ